MVACNEIRSLVLSIDTFMKLSFLPGDLHLSKDASGFFVVTMCGRELLSTKSQRSAVARFNAIRAELESEFPTRAPTQNEVWLSDFESEWWVFAAGFALMTQPQPVSL